MSRLSEELSALAGTWIVTEAVVDCPVGVVTQLVTADSLRWALILSQSTMGSGPQAQVLFGVSPSAGMGQGVAVVQTAPWLSLNYRDWGGLVQAAWHCNNLAANPARVTVITVRAQQ